MKKITLFFAALTLSFSAMAQAMHGTYTVGTNGTENYASLKAAIDAVNANGIDGDLLLEITTNLTEASNVWLGVNTGTYTLTIKPATGVQPTISFTSTTNVGLSTSIDGCFVIGSPSGDNANLIATNNVVIDGSNAVGGTSKDMTILGPTMTIQKSVIRIYGNNDNIVIKNCIITNQSSSSSSTTPIMLTDYTTLAPDNFTALNNTLNSSSGNGALGVSVSVTGTPTALMTGIKIQNNIVSARATRGIFFNYVADGEISGNTISHDCQLGTGAAATIVMMSGGSGVAGTFNVFNNKIKQMKTWNTTAGPAASNGIIGIDNQLASPKIVNIYNNFITGFTIATATVQGVKVYGIRHTGGSTSNIMHNTIVMNELTDMTTTTNSFLAGIAFATANTTSPYTEAAPSGTMNVNNNIIISKESTMKVWGIRRVGSTGTFTSNNNIIYASTSNNYTGYFDASDAATLTNWQTASSQDANSKSVAVSFTDVANGDLTLSGASIQDNNLSVPLLTAVPTDMFGTVRSNPTYAGAHESTLPFIVTSNAQIEENIQLMHTASGIAINLDNESTVEIYSINGVRIEKAIASGLYTHDLNSGVYIVKINGKSQKFIK